MKNRIKYCKKNSKKKFNYLHSNEFNIYKDSEKTVFDIDFSDWKFQKENNTIVRKNYDSLYLPHISIEAFVKTKYSLSRTYISGNIMSARSFLLNSLLNKLENELQKKIPTLLMIEYKKIDNGNREFISEYRSCGLESEYKKLNIFLQTEFIFIIEDYIVNNILKNIENYTFVNIEECYRGDLNYNYIIGDLNSAKKIHLKSFFVDFEEFQQPIEYLEKIEHKIFNKFKRVYLKYIENVLNKKTL